MKAPVLLGTFLIVLASQPLAAQTTAWSGLRTYYGGPEGMANGTLIQLQPTEITELGVEVRPFRLGQISFGIQAIHFSGGYGGTGEPAVLSYRNTFDGYSFRLPVHYTFARPGGRNVLDLVMEAGIERIQIVESPWVSRFIASGGIEFRGSLYRSLSISIGLQVSTLGRSMVSDSDLPEDFQNRNYSWKTLRLGLSLD